MIFEDETKRLKDILGNHYIRKVRKTLNDKGIYNRNGTEYSDASISQVFTGKRQGSVIEDAILETVVNEKKQKEEAQLLKDTILYEDII